MQGSSASGLPAVIHHTAYPRSGLAICEPYFVQSLMVLLYDKNWNNLADDDHEVLSPFCLHGDCLNWEIFLCYLLANSFAEGGLRFCIFPAQDSRGHFARQQAAEESQLQCLEQLHCLQH